MRAVVLTIFAALVLSAAPAQAQSGVDTYVYAPCAEVGRASVVEVVGAPCSQAQAVAARVAASSADGEAPALVAAGWTPVRASSTDDASQHDLVATRDGAALRLRLDGAAPDLDGFAAGRELLFASRRLVGGRPVPRGTSVCTSSWLVQLRSGSLGGLSAAHCGGLRRDNKVRRGFVGLRRPPQAGVILGRVQRILTRSRPLDALLVPVPSGTGRTRVPIVDRGVSRPPWTVIGLGRPLSGRAICYSGRTSGIDQCGQIVSSRARRGEAVISGFAGVRVRCTTIRARQGDSGGPVYTAPSSDGRVFAVGIVTLILLANRQMCFTPLGPVLDGFNARLVTG